MRLTFRLLMLAASCGMALLEQAAVADTETFSVIYGGQNVGHLIADTDGSRTQIDFDYKNNGRGPTIAETIVTDELGRPRSWQISGATTFGSKVDERFEWSGATARWTDPAGPGEATMGEPKIYVAEGASPWALGLYARVLLADPDRTAAALPSGTLSLEKGQAFQLAGAS
ncbi:MAG TPA: amidohydrolase, partial [Gammaproteobacteria bacterium]|nr:amidohydrolase [Gammaproteobacteria bacterium]